MPTSLNDQIIFMTSVPLWLPQLIHVVLNLLNGVFHTNWQVETWPVWVLLLLWSVILFTMVAVVAKAAVIFMVLMERKVLAWLTQRKGPNRVGPWGILQTLADGVKLLFKEDIMTPAQDKLLFTLGPAIFFIPCFVFVALIPFSTALIGVNLPAGALFVFALSSISVIGIVLSGWASNNKYSLLGGMRSAAQAISYEIPLILSVLAVVLYAGSMNLNEIVMQQQGGLNLFNLKDIPGIGAALGDHPFFLIPNWYVLTLLPISFMVFFTSAIAEVNRIPFDLPEAESELVSGYNTEYSGMKFALFFLAEYASLFAMCAFTVVFFFGGYLSPFGFYLIDLDVVHQFVSGIPVIGSLKGFLILIQQVEMLFWFLMKTYIFVFVAFWIRGTLPRLKPDQLMGFSWKFLIPLCLVNIFVIAMQRYWNIAWPHPGEALPFQWPAFIAWVVLVFAGFGGFFQFSGYLFNKKLQARLDQAHAQSNPNEELKGALPA